MLKVGVIGAGSVMRAAHAGAYEGRDDVRVAAIAEPVAEWRQALGERLGCDVFFDSYEELLARADVDAVDICLPHWLHGPTVMAALNAGKHVILDKPIALSLAEADEMIATAKAKDLKFFVALNQRFHAPHREMHAICAGGTEGQPFLAIMHVLGDEFANMNNPGHWKGDKEKAGGGALLDTGTHIFDLSRWWFGRPKTISCQGGRFVVEPENKAEDNVIVTLGYDHMMVNLLVSYTACSDPWTEDKAIYFRDASYHLSFDPDRALRKVTGKGAGEPIAVQAEEAWWSASVSACVSHFLDCILGKATPEYGPEAAREVLELLELAYTAMREGRTVEVPEA